MVQSTDNSSAERTAVSIPMSEEFKKAFREWADAHEYKVLSKAGQFAIARLIGYDLKNEPEPKARSRYGTDESGMVDREYARLRNSYKASLETQYLRATQKARKDKDTAKLDSLDSALLLMESRDWEPITLDGDPDIAKRIEIRWKAINNLVEAKKLPADYDDEKLEELRAESPDSE